MALRFQIDKLEDVDAPLRTHYVAAKDGKYQLTFDDEHPDTAKLKEFRTTNVELTKKLADFEGLDPASVKADKVRLAELEKAKPHERITALEAELATEKASRTAAQAVADASVLKSTVADAFLRAGGRNNALDFIVAKAQAALTVENGAVVGKVFDPNKPGEKLTVEGFIALQIRESDFAFLPSNGGGAPSRLGGGRPPASNQLVDPTPHQLGEHASDIKAGTLKVVYTNS